MKCRNCGTELLDTDRFCIKCGALVETKISTCPFCGAELREDERFCHRCGAEVPMPGENKNFGLTGEFPNMLNTTEIGVLSEAVIAATEAQIGRAETPAPTASVVQSEAVPAAHAGTQKQAAAPEKYATPGQDEEISSSAAGTERERKPRVRPANAAAASKTRKERVEERYAEDTQESGLLGKLTLLVGVCIFAVMLVALYFFAVNNELLPPLSFSGFGHTARESAAAEETEESEEKGNAGAPLGTLTVNTGNLNIRDGAGTEGTKVLGKAEKGREYEYYAVEGDWYYIDAGNGVMGYVNKGYVTVK